MCYDFAQPMKLSRNRRVLTALLTFLSLLFTQLAVAAYACPAGAGMVAGAPARDARAGNMSHCARTDPAKPGLCHAHCANAQQSADTPAAPPVLPFVATSLVGVLPTTVATTTAPERAAAAVLPERASAPPLSIRHCCFRI